MRVYLVEPHGALREALSRLLSVAAGIQVVGASGTAASAVRDIARCAPHVAIIGDGLPDGDELSLCWALAQETPRLRIILHPAMTDPSDACSVELIGASACVVKGVRINPLVEAARRAFRDLLQSEREALDLRAAHVQDVRDRSLMITENSRRLQEEARQQVAQLTRLRTLRQARHTQTTPIQAKPTQDEALQRSA